MQEYVVADWYVVREPTEDGRMRLAVRQIPEGTAPPAGVQILSGPYTREAAVRARAVRALTF
jgi:hypothetical protein